MERKRYRVDSQIPILPRLLNVDEDFFVRETEVFEGDVGALSPGAIGICVEDYLGRCHCY
jgi:hypothetical protein